MSEHMGDSEEFPIFTMDEGSAAMHELYGSLRASGFSDCQAMRLVSSGNFPPHCPVCQNSVGDE